MKLNQKSIKNLQDLLSLCSIADIESVVIEDNAIRGISEDKSCVIISDKNIPDFGEGAKIGLSRLGVLATRISLFKDDDQMTVDAKINDRNEVSTLEISNPSAKIQFRCTSPSLIRAPKKVNDEASFSVSINKEDIPFIISGAKSMSSKRVTIAGKANGIYLEFTDTNQDVCSIKVSEPNDKIVAVQLPANSFLSLLKTASGYNDEEKQVTIVVGEVGSVNFAVGAHSIIILPLAQE